MSTEYQPLVTVVTPAYNEENYLVECIESILAQTYSNWEYVILDNCSTDATAAIACSYSKRDPRVRLLKTPRFLSAVANHNFALQQGSLSSRYCKVVLADDWIFAECLERMVAVAEEHPSVGIVGAYALEGEAVKWAGLAYPSTMVAGREICRRHLLDGLYVFGTPTSVLYRADLVRGHDPFYNEANIHADTEVCFELLKESDFGFVHQVLSFTRIRPGSLSAEAAEVQSCLAGMLQILVSHGGSYLGREELAERLEQHLREYYAFLAKMMVLRADKLFWDYHKRQLSITGVGFSRVRLAKAAVSQIVDAALNPKGTLEKLRRRRNHHG